MWKESEENPNKKYEIDLNEVFSELLCKISQTHNDVGRRMIYPRIGKKKSE
jgi:hypothetical protein